MPSDWTDSFTLVGVQQGQPYVIRAADLALVVRRRRWSKKTPPATTVPDRLAAVARISGAIKRDE